jgi:glycosyltransferase involved in cell wall biosynthesis
MSTTSRGPFALALSVLRSEGLRATVNRTLDRVEEIRRVRALQQLAHGDFGIVTQLDPPTVLNLSPIPLSPRRGGSQIQMLDRLEREKTLRPVAVAYPRDGALAVEVWTKEVSGIFSLDMASGVGSAVAEAARLLATTTVHIENLHGFPFELIDSLEDQGFRTVLSIHDFTLFCRRPHLIESTTSRFCEYSRDLDRCRTCLGDSDERPPNSQTEYRGSSAQALGRASAVIYPSGFLRRAHRELFPEPNRSAIEEVISPATSRPEQPINKEANPAIIGFVGGFSTHKGGALIRPIMDRITAEVPRIRAFVYGNGEDRFSREIRSSGRVRVRGYYRQGALPSLLARDRVGVAVLSSIWPEAYALVVDECLASGVPVVAFDLGAVGERLTSWGVGRLAALDEGSDGLARAILDCVSSPPGIPGTVIDQLPRPKDTARQHLALYQRLSSD